MRMHRRQDAGQAGTRHADLLQAGEGRLADKGSAQTASGLHRAYRGGRQRGAAACRATWRPSSGEGEGVRGGPGAAGDVPCPAQQLRRCAPVDTRPPGPAAPGTAAPTAGPWGRPGGRTWLQGGGGRARGWADGRAAPPCAALGWPSQGQGECCQKQSGTWTRRAAGTAGEKGPGGRGSARRATGSGSRLLALLATRQRRRPRSVRAGPSTRPTAPPGSILPQARHAAAALA